VAYLGTFENEVLAVDLGEAAVRWRFRDAAREFPFYASAALAPGLVVVAGRDKQVRALDRATGKERWSFATRARIDASPVVVGDRALVAAGTGELFALDLATGEPRWSFDAGSPFTASPAVGAGRLVVGTADGTLLAFGTAPGASR
jgi:outer membrane protein assembly factor BamB